MPLAIHTRLGPYQIVSPLGAGGMGEVYRARDTRLGRDVAIKVLPQHRSATGADRSRFLREARAISSLNHPHICVLHDIGREGDMDYLVMELVPGETLAHRISRGPLPVTEILKLGAQIANALGRAHQAGIVHRDLKPGNVMLTKNGAKLMDFGLARATDHGIHRSDSATATAQTEQEPITGTGIVVGTFQYMAPEQLEGREASARSDIWALGCVLYEMATGRRAFEGTTQASVISAIMRDQPRAIAALAPLTPPSFERLVLSCLTKDPDERIQNARDVEHALRWIAEGGADEGTAAVPRRASLRRLAWPLAAIAASGLLVTFLALRATDTTTHLSFTQRTFKPMAISRSKFAPDGKTIVLSAQTDSTAIRIFVLRPEYPDVQPISDPGTQLLSVSPQGEMAVLTHARRPNADLFLGTLARMPLGGGAPREILDDVREADWAPDGTNLAVLHEVDGRDQIEFPIGKPLLVDTWRKFTDLHVSPKGDRIAFFEHESPLHFGGSLSVIDLRGKKSVLARGLSNQSGMTWSRDGSALYFSACDSANDNVTVFRVTLSGKQRYAFGSAGGLRVQDVADGPRWLAIRDDGQNALMVHRPGWSEDHDLSWLDGSADGQLSRDGSVIAFTEYSPAVGKRFAACIRMTDGSPVTRLGEGRVWDLSEDGKQVLVLLPTTPPQLLVQHTGAGGVIPLPRGTIADYNFGEFLRGSESIFFIANEPGKPERDFVQDIKGGLPKAVTPEGTWWGGASPDGKTLLARGPDGRYWMYPLKGGPPMPAPSLTPNDFLFRWNPDGRTVIVSDPSKSQKEYVQVDLETGRRTSFTIPISLPMGFRSWNLGEMTPDGTTFVYGAYWATSTLFTVDALK